MTRPESDGIMRMINDIWGGFPQSSFETWFSLFQKYNELEIRNAVWTLSETLKTKPRMADLVEAIGRGGRSGGGSNAVDPTDCIWCAGSGWATLERQPREFTTVRCMCPRGDRLSAKFTRLTQEDAKVRRTNIVGQVVFKNENDMSKENKLAAMKKDELIAWCKKGLKNSTMGRGM